MDNNILYSLTDEKTTQIMGGGEFILIGAYVMMIWAAIRIFKAIRHNIASKSEASNFNNQLVANKALVVSNLMQSVIDITERLPAPVASGELTHYFERFAKELDELQQMVHNAPSTANLSITVDGQKVPVRNIINGAIMFKGEVKRRIHGL